MKEALANVCTDLKKNKKYYKKLVKEIQNEKKSKCDEKNSDFCLVNGEKKQMFKNRLIQVYNYLANILKKEN
ncbi:hypothetical protein GVAV_003346 [Gurleya vavrai]